MFRITEGGTQTYITCMAPDDHKPKLVVSVTRTTSEFHNFIGWELFEKLVAGELDQAQAKELRSQLVVKYRPVVDD